MKLNISFIDIFLNKLKKEYNYNNSYISRKFSEKDYVQEIFSFLSNCVYWNRYSGHINGKTLNNKHNFYVKLDIYRKTYLHILNCYLKSNKYNKLKFLSIDSTFINNKKNFNKNLIGRNKYYRNKKGIKISTIVDVNGIPLSLLIIKGSIHDSKTLIPTFNNLFLNLNIKKSINYKYHFLADSGYDNKRNKCFIKNHNFIDLIK